MTMPFVADSCAATNVPCCALQVFQPRYSAVSTAQLLQQHQASHPDHASMSGMQVSPGRGLVVCLSCQPAYHGSAHCARHWRCTTHTFSSRVCLALRCSVTSLIVCPQVTAMAAVPAMISDLAAHHAQLPGSYPGVRKVLLGAASADSALPLRLHFLFPNAQARLPYTFLTACQCCWRRSNAPLISYLYCHLPTI